MHSVIPFDTPNLTVQVDLPHLLKGCTVDLRGMLTKSVHFIHFSGWTDSAGRYIYGLAGKYQGSNRTKRDVELCSGGWKFAPLLAKPQWRYCVWKRIWHNKRIWRRIYCSGKWNKLQFGDSGSCTRRCWTVHMWLPAHQYVGFGGSYFTGYVFRNVLNWGRQVCPAPGPNSFIFMQFSEKKIGQMIDRCPHLDSWCCPPPPIWEILDPRLQSLSKFNIVPMVMDTLTGRMCFRPIWPVNYWPMIVNFDSTGHGVGMRKQTFKVDLSLSLLRDPLLGPI